MKEMEVGKEGKMERRRKRNEGKREWNTKGGELRGEVDALGCGERNPMREKRKERKRMKYVYGCL